MLLTEFKNRTSGYNLQTQVLQCCYVKVPTLCFFGYYLSCSVHIILLHVTITTDWNIWPIRAEKTNHNRLGHLTNQSRVDQSQQTGSSDQSEQSRPITTV